MEEMRIPGVAHIKYKRCFRWLRVGSNERLLPDCEQQTLWCCGLKEAINQVGESQIMNDLIGVMRKETRDVPANLQNP